MIEVRNLTKHFGPKVAVDNISFRVAKGEVLGFLGPNGAGKSTTMRMVTGYYPPTAGEIAIGGISMLENPVEAKRKIGYLPENAPLYTDLSVQGFLSYAAELRGLTGSAKKQAVERAIETTFLQRVARQALDTLSKGYRHRTCLAQSLIHDPEILILDEPTDGLDPNQKHEVRQLLKRLGHDKAIVFSTHILEEVEAACSRAIIIDQGRVVADGSPDELKSRARRSGSVKVKISGLAGSGIRQELERLPAADAIEAEADAESEAGFTGLIYPKARTKSELAGQVFDLCKSRSWNLGELHTDEGRLDEMFREITAQDKA
ncbi:MAG: ATP-binding cassette domain-containing protein [Verrucomicrobiales bacterium]|nr:ATP-binding cassette domain-containing protein [Verrucomicrobiales bacterium]